MSTINTMVLGGEIAYYMTSQYNPIPGLSAIGATAFSHHFVIIEGSDAKYHKFEFDEDDGTLYTVHNNISSAKHCRQTLRSTIHQTIKTSYTFENESIQEMQDFTNNYTNAYGEFSPSKNNSQNFALRFWSKFVEKVEFFDPANVTYTGAKGKYASHVAKNGMASVKAGLGSANAGIGPAQVKVVAPNVSAQASLNKNGGSLMVGAAMGSVGADVGPVGVTVGLSAETGVSLTKDNKSIKVLGTGIHAKDGKVGVSVAGSGVDCSIM